MNSTYLPPHLLLLYLEPALPERQQSLALDVSSHLIPFEIFVSSRSPEHRVEEGFAR